MDGTNAAAAVKTIAAAEAAVLLLCMGSVWTDALHESKQVQTFDPSVFGI